MATDIIARGLATQRPPSYIFVENFSALPADPITNQLYYASNSEGTAWLPGTLGGTYHPAGPYYYDGGQWKYMDSTIAATQEEVNAGIESYKFVSPNTLQNSSQLQLLGLSITQNNQELELQSPWKVGYDLYEEFVFTNGDLTQVNYWMDNQKITKLFTKDITYTNGNPTTIVLKDELSGKLLTTTIVYSGSDISNITKILN